MAQQVLDSPQAISQCLCLWQDVERRAQILETQKTEYEKARQTYQQLDQEAVRQRPLVDTSSEQAIQAYTDLLRRAEAALRQLNDRAVPTYNRAVTDYTQAANAYNAQCSGKSYDAEVLASVQRTLNCPAR